MATNEYDYKMNIQTTTYNSGLSIADINKVIGNATTAQQAAANKYSSIGAVSTAGAAQNVYMGSGITVSNPNYYNTSYTVAAPVPEDFTLSSPSGKEIVRVDKDGEVTWNSGIDITEAASAFSKSISIGLEMRAGITERVKKDIRNSIFEDIISIAKTKGSLSADDLEMILEATKIMEKLKGPQ